MYPQCADKKNEPVLIIDTICAVHNYVPVSRVPPHVESSLVVDVVVVAVVVIVVGVVSIKYTNANRTNTHCAKHQHHQRRDLQTIGRVLIISP